jgi:P-type conjugative transfer protein TrbG
LKTRSTAVVRYLAVCAAAVGLAVGAPRFAGAATFPSLTLPDGSMRFDYGRRPTPVLVCKPHYVCDITLDSGESVLNMAIGDSARWVIAGGQSGPSGTTPHIFVKPTQPGLDTNLVITTTKRVYDVVLRSAVDAKYSRISFFYADLDAAAKAAIAQQVRAAVEGALSGTPLVSADRADSKYKVTGEPVILPDKVFNDGARTYIQWKALPVELPAVFEIGKDNAQHPQNFAVVGTSYIIDGINPSYDLVLAAGTEKHGRPERRASIRHL